MKISRHTGLKCKENDGETDISLSLTHSGLFIESVRIDEHPVLQMFLVKYLQHKLK